MQAPPRWQPHAVAVAQAAREARSRPLSAVAAALTMASCERWCSQAPAPVERPPCSCATCATPEPGAGEIRVRVHVCGVCRTDLHVVEGDLPPRRDRVDPRPSGGRRGRRARRRVHALAARRSASASPGCAVPAAPATAAGAATRTCASRRRFTGYDADGGYAEYAVVRRGLRLRDSRFDRRRRGRAAALRRDHRLPRPAARRDAARMPARPLRVRRLGAHRDPGRAPSRLPRLRDDTRREAPQARRGARRRMDWSRRRQAAGETRQRRAVRPRRRARTARPRGARPRRDAGRRRDLSHRRSRRSITRDTSSTSATCAA